MACAVAVVLVLAVAAEGVTAAAMRGEASAALEARAAGAGTGAGGVVAPQGGGAAAPLAPARTKQATAAPLALVQSKQADKPAHCVAGKDDDSDLCTWMHSNRVAGLWSMVVVRWWTWMEMYGKDPSMPFCLSDLWAHFSFTMTVACMLWLDGDGPVDKSVLRQTEGESLARTATYGALFLYAYQHMGLFGGDGSNKVNQAALIPPTGTKKKTIVDRIFEVVLNESLLYLLFAFIASELGLAVASAHVLSGAHFVSMTFTMYMAAFFRIWKSRSPELLASTQGVKDVISYFISC